MDDVVLGLGKLLAFSRRQEIVHFFFRNLNALVDVAALHSLDDHFPSHLFSHGTIGLALLLQRHPKLIQRQSVLGGNALHGAIELGIGDTHTYPHPFLQLDALQYQPVQRFPDKGFFRRHLHTPGPHTFRDGGNSLAQFTGHDDVVIDNGHDLVDDLGGGTCRRCDEHSRRQACR